MLVYSIDPHDPEKQQTAAALLRDGATSQTIKLPHQAVAEFFSVVTRSRRGAQPLLGLVAAVEVTERLLAVYEVLYPSGDQVRLALRGAAAYQLSWYDAHLWAYAEHFGLDVLYSEDFQHDRLYGSVRVINPFV